MTQVSEWINLPELPSELSRRYPHNMWRRTLAEKIIGIHHIYTIQRNTLTKVLFSTRHRKAGSKQNTAPKPV